MRVLVTGGNRYIGRHVVEELARRGHDVTVFNSHESPLPAGVRRLHGDRTQAGVVDAVLGPVRDEFDAVLDNTSYQLDDVEPLVALFRGRVSATSSPARRRSTPGTMSSPSRSRTPWTMTTPATRRGATAPARCAVNAT